MSNIRFIWDHTSSNYESEYPTTISISVQCDGDSNLQQIVNAFKMFLKAMEFSEKSIDEHVN